MNFNDCAHIQHDSKLIIPSAENESKYDDNDENNGNDDSHKECCVVRISLYGLGPAGLSMLLPACVSSDLEPIHCASFQMTIAVANLHNDASN